MKVRERGRRGRVKKGSNLKKESGYAWRIEQKEQEEIQS